MTDRTPAQAAQLAELKAWLMPQYEAGAHWVIECFEDAQLLEEIEAYGMAGAKKALRRHWKLMEEQCRAARADSGEW